MKKSILLLMLSFFCTYGTFAQIEIETNTEGDENGIPIMTTILSDDNGGYFGEIFVDADFDCMIDLKFPFYATNLQSFPVNDDRDLFTDLFDLPISRPDMELVYNIDNNTGIAPITSFEYVDRIKINGLFVTIFVSYVNIEIDASAYCASPDYLIMNYDLSLMTSESVSGEGLGSSPYPICQFLAEGDIFQCGVFPFCADYEDPSAIPDLCNQEDIHQKIGGDININCITICSPDIDPNPDNRTVNDNPFDVRVSPNPFNSSVNLTFSNDESEVINFIEIYNSTGSKVHRIEGVLLVDMEEYTLDLSHLASGLYFLKVEGEKSKKTLKLLKQ